MICVEGFTLSEDCGSRDKEPMFPFSIFPLSLTHHKGQGLESMWGWNVLEATLYSQSLNNIN